ncbi:MAG: OB-fold domain-containing protein [Burkholderiales bacterium]|nr:OB-fold domain-containing protein [Burkholderiales bacterium]MDE2455809.1 OB-fold domain-containing protein [Burkholderiales bacterium]
MRAIPAPRVLPETRAYWQAADEGRLLVKRCTACGRHHHYPRDVCPFCWSDATEWTEARGQATVYSFSTMGEGEAAYTLAYVTLDEGPTMLTNLVDADPASWRIGQRVRVVFRASAGGPAVPMFAPA